jgi:hypothetical protein
MLGLLAASVVFIEVAPAVACIMAVGGCVKLILDSAEVAQRIAKNAREGKKP